MSKDTPTLQSKFYQHQTCILIPTFNNAGTLKRVIDQILQYTESLIVINDGSTDNTAEILSNYPQIDVHHIEKNGGKGKALRKGFAIALASGYQYVITMDSDGQHYPDDLPVFLDVLENKKTTDPEPLIIGSRKMDDPSVPDKSSVGNKISTFMFWIVTGIRLRDTQCGYRLYPLELVNSLKLFTSKFELEIEVLVKAAWKGSDVQNIPVKVLYDPDERVTHFRPFQDVVRITLLNIFFLFGLVFFIIPRNIIRSLQDKPRSESCHKAVNITSEPAQNEVS